MIRARIPIYFTIYGHEEKDVPLFPASTVYHKPQEKVSRLRIWFLGAPPLNPKPFTALEGKEWATLKPKPKTLNPKPKTLSLKP